MHRIFGATELLGGTFRCSNGEHRPKAETEAEYTSHSANVFTSLPSALNWKPRTCHAKLERSLHIIQRRSYSEFLTRTSRTSSIVGADEMLLVCLSSGSELFEILKF